MNNNVLTYLSFAPNYLRKLQQKMPSWHLVTPPVVVCGIAATLTPSLQRGDMECVRVGTPNADVPLHACHQTAGPPGGVSPSREPRARPGGEQTRGVSRRALPFSIPCCPRAVMHGSQL